MLLAGTTDVAKSRMLNHEERRRHVFRDRLVDVEARIGKEIRDGLAQRGHTVNAIADWSWIVGGGQGVMRDPASGALMAGADPPAEALRGPVGRGDEQGRAVIAARQVHAGCPLEQEARSGDNSVSLLGDH